MDFFIIIVVGSLWGSFANVCIYRLPLEKGVITGRSYCPKCKKKIVWYDNIPIISYLIIQGKCRKCKKKIPLQYPLVEFLTIVSFLIIYSLYGITTTTLLLITLSSGTIEDSLNSKVPVILYDLKNRYKQMECEKTDKDSNVVYYIDDKNKIEYVITKIKNSKKLDFEDYIYNGNIKENINNKFLPIISKYTK